MRLANFVVGILWLVLAAGSCHAGCPDDGGAPPLNIGVHTSDSVSLYSPRYEGGDWQSQFGVMLKTELENQLGHTFPKVTPLTAFPPLRETQEPDAYVVLVQSIARFYGRGTMNAEGHAAVSVYDARREHVRDIEAATEFTAKLPPSRDAQQARFEAGVQEVARDLAAKLVAGIMDPELQLRLKRSAAEVSAQRTHPAPPPARPTSFGRLVLTTTPAGATVFVDDVYWGQSNTEGKLTVAGLGTGSHVVRLTASGYDELRQTVEVVPGDNPVALKAHKAGPKPLSEVEIEDALRHEVPRQRMTALVREYGVTFELTKESEIRLRDAGADNDLLLAIAESKK